MPPLPLRQIERPPRYTYYDTPDGQDYFKKTYYLCRPAAWLGTIHAVHDSLLLTKPVGVLPTIDRFIRVFSRPVLGVILFETTVYIATNLRSKDDPWNHVIGGIATARFFARFTQHTASIWGVAFPILIGLYVCKDFKQKYDSMYFVPDYSIREDHCSSVWSNYNSRWQLREKIPREWKRADEVVQKKD